MSSRALRKLQGDSLAFPTPTGTVSGTSAEADEDIDSQSGSERDEEEVPVAPQGKKKKKKKKNKPSDLPANPFDLLNEEATGEQALGSDVEHEGEHIHTEETPSARGGSGDLSQQSVKKKRKKKKKNKESKQLAENVGGAQEEEDEIDAGIREVNRILGAMPNAGTNPSSPDSIGWTLDARALLTVEHRNLNADNEMRRIFGSRVVQSDQSHQRRQRNRVYHKSMWLARPKDNWPPFGKTGLSMNLLETRHGYQYFALEHSKAYQQVQFEFLDAVESLDPQNIINLLHIHPHHGDSLLQVSDICRMSDDTPMAADMIERALYVYECSFHPSFSLTQGSSRLDYRRPENRGFYVALFRHLLFVGKRGCYRTALELCKLILSLDPDGDPMAILLMMDFYALRSQQYSFLIRMFQEWEAHRNLSQLPNFAFSVPLAMFHQAKEDDLDTGPASHMLQEALLMFPALLTPLLDKCSVAPDPRVAQHAFFGITAQLGQARALEQLQALYVGRSHPCWKDPEVISWLETNVNQVLNRVDAGDPIVQENAKKKQVRYQGTPRNIYRHIMMAEVKEATAALPPEMAHTPVLSFDPLPPTDSIHSYTRPERPRRAQQSSNALSMFFQSLLPNFNPQELVEEDPPGAAGGAAGGNNLREGIMTLMNSMRDLLNNIQPVPPPVEQPGNQQPQDEEPQDDQDFD